MTTGTSSPSGGAPPQRPPARLERLFADHHRAVLAYAARRTRPPGDLATAEDVAAAVFQRCWQRLDDVPDDALPWLLVTARHVLSETTRGQSRRRERERAGEADRALNSARTGPDAGDVAVRAITVRAALERLSADDRELVTLVAWDDLPLTTAAQVLGISHAAARQRWHRARARLAHALDLPDEPEARVAATHPTPLPLLRTPLTEVRP